MVHTSPMPVEESSHLLFNQPFVWPYVSAILGNIYFFVITSIFALFFMVGICLIIKYTPHVLYDIKNRFGMKISQYGIAVWFIFICLLPIFFDSGPLWFILWWFILLWEYANKAEKRLVSIFILFLFMIPPITYLGGSFLTYARTHLNREMFTIETFIASKQDELNIVQWVNFHPDDPDPINTLAITKIRTGDYSDAIHLLRYSLKLEPNNPRLYNHLGIAFFETGNYTDSIDAFKKAVSINPNNVIYHYNLSRVYQTMYNLYETENEIIIGSTLDPKRFKKLVEANRNTTHILAEESTPTLRLLARQMQPSKDLDLAADALWDFSAGIINRNIAVWFVCIYVGLLLLFTQIPNKMFSKRCPRCGELYYIGYPSPNEHKICLQCYWFITGTKKLSKSITLNRSEKIRKYEDHLKLYSSTLERLFPGMGSIVADKTLSGIVRLSMLSVGLVMAISGGYFIFSFIPTHIDLRPHLRIIGVLIILYVYLMTYRHPPLEKGS